MAANTASGGRRKIIVLVVIALLVVAGGAGALLWRQHQQALLAAAKNNPANAEAVKLDTRSTDVKVAANAASVQAAKGDTNGAAQTLNAAIAGTSRNDEKATLYLQLASTYADVGVRDQALKAEQSAIDLQPNNWRLYKNQGAIYEQLGDPTDAKASFQKADDLLKATPDYNTYHSELMGLIKNAGNS